MSWMMLLILIALMIAGCESSDERLAGYAERPPTHSVVAAVHTQLHWCPANFFSNCVCHSCIVTYVARMLYTISICRRCFALKALLDMEHFLCSPANLGRLNTVPAMSHKQILRVKKNLQPLQTPVKTRYFSEFDTRFQQAYL